MVWLSLFLLLHTTSASTCLRNSRNLGTPFYPSPSFLFTGFSDFSQLTDIIRANYDYWKEQNDREEDEKGNDDQEKKQGVAASTSASSVGGAAKDTLREATEEEETTAESSHRQLDDIPSIDDEN